jgi:hypothetical protein
LISYDHTNQRDTLLENEEKKWPLKSRAIWIKESNNNTKFFHHVMNYDKNMNMISEVRTIDGSVVPSFKEKKKEGVHHFKSLFHEPIGCLIQEIMEVILKLSPVLWKN